MDMQHVGIIALAIIMAGGLIAGFLRLLLYDFRTPPQHNWSDERVTHLGPAWTPEDMERLLQAETQRGFDPQGMTYDEMLIEAGRRARAR